MPLDPNIIMGLKQPQIEGPLDAYGKALTLKNLINQNQIGSNQAQQSNQDFSDNQAMRSAMSNNTKIDANGAPTINRAGVLSDLAKVSPSLVPKVAQNFASMDFEIQQQKLKSARDQIDTGGQILNGAKDQASYNDALNQMKSIGLDTSNLPSQYDPSIVSAAQAKAMTVKDHITAQMEQQKIGLQQEDLAVKRQQFQQTKYQESFKDLMSHAESSKQLPDVKQAYLDRYNTQKILDLIGTKDPDKINPNMVNLLVSEVGKVAQGASPTEETLKNLTPNDAKMILAKTQQYLTSNPQAGKQGAFVEVFKDYAKTLQLGANKVIDSNMGKLGKAYEPWVSKGDFKNFQDTYVRGNPLQPDRPGQMKAGNSSEEKGGSTTNQEAANQKQKQNFGADVLAYAQKHGITAEQAQSVKTQRLMGNK